MDRQKSTRQRKARLTFTSPTCLTPVAMIHPFNFVFPPLSKPLLPHDVFFEHLRSTEYSRLDETGQVYLDYTGGGLHSSTQVIQQMGQLLTGVHGNPHSVNPTSARSTDEVEQARAKVLEFFNATDDYVCIFTANASAALKIVGECYPFSDDGTFLLTADNHNSVNGIREYCAGQGGTFHYAPIRQNLTLDAGTLKQMLCSLEGRNKLFAFPAQSNVSGVRHKLKWVRRAKRQGWDVLLDAAAFVPTSPLSLSKVKPEFVAVSFYKIFGYPTGIGALLVRKDALDKLNKPWYAGGNITLSSVGAEDRFFHSDHQRFEDGTLNYLDIPAIGKGIDFITAIGMDRLKERVDALADMMCRELSTLQHSNGQPLVRILGPVDRSNCGGNLAFNVLDSAGAAIPIQTVEAKAASQGISLRTGCFCNPGVDEANHAIPRETLQAYFKERAHGDYFDFMAFSHQTRGAVRVSVGVATNRSDIEALVELLSEFRDPSG